MQVFSAVAVCVLLFGCCAGVQGYHVVGKFGDQIIPIDVTFGTDIMEVTAHKPANALDSFRETTNLHVFSTSFVAIRNAVDQQCYIQRFNATMTGMKRRLEEAKRAHDVLDGVKEEWLRVDKLSPLKTWTVKLLFGPHIADFCLHHEVFLVDSKYSGLVDAKQVNPNMRHKRGFFFKWRPIRKCISQFARRVTSGVVFDPCNTDVTVVC
ncbi:uncharacterized protein LOC124132144 [Haliotis rufescens]|uniref:uncharacterized protein LOC124132144 n=1 Tax=Haliotis rufescens TaxID=6454 RepID=UPI00201EB5FD|nr:uncharacterized protein LOC124132144 [Haliotis rufescens]